MEKNCNGISQESILGPPIFNIFLCELFLRWPYDNIPYSANKRNALVIKGIEQFSEVLFQ